MDRPTTPTVKTIKDYRDLVAIAQLHRFHVTSTNKGRHNVGSRHYQGLAIDVRTRDKTEAQIQQLRKYCETLKIWFYDERTRPPGQKVWTGAHIHLEIIK